jgi:EAL domain-containing protein (putative c-di-GMP-specific phosphodiesterase class I)
MYRSKDTGRARYCVFEPEMDAAVKSRRAIERDLRHALETGGLTLAYQPQVDAQGLVTGVEALLRWMHPERGAISPAYFVSVAEESGLMDALGAFVLRQAFTDSHRWPAMKMAVNISAVQLRAADFVDQVLEIVRETGARPERIELEITEGVLLADDDSTQATLLRLKALGFSIALDDFGTGYSSLAYLRRFPIDKIKIDRSFVINLGIEKQSDAVVSAIVKLAKALHLSVIAEGVETEVQAAELRRIGCRDIQGYFYGKPMAADRLDAFLATRESSAEIAA